MTKRDSEATQAAGGQAKSTYGGPAGLRRELGLLLLAGVAATILNRLLYQALGWPASSPMPGRTLVLVGALWLLMRAKGDSFRTLGLCRPTSAARAVSAAVIFFLIKLSLLQPAKDWIRDALQLPPPDLSFLHGLEGHFGLYIFWLSVAVLAGGFGEELLFRGFLITRLEDLLGGNRAALVSAISIQAALFGLGHAYQGLGAVLTIFLGALASGAVFVLAGRNLWPLIAVHATWDSLGITLYYLGVVGP